MKIAFPHKPGAGGPGSFQARFEQKLKKKGYEIIYAGTDLKPDLVFVVGGTKKILWLVRCKIEGIPILYRLDGINWLHRVSGTRQRSISNYLRSSLINFLNKIIHGFIANHVIYQSEFVKEWWEKENFKIMNSFSIIKNGVDQSVFKKQQENNSDYIPRLVCLEGFLDYSPYAITLINELGSYFGDRLEVYGGIKFESEKKNLNKDVNYKGVVEKNRLPKIYAGSIYISLDVNPACPNTVIEALSSGAPVVAFDTGAIPELVENGKSGIVVPYGSDPWQLGKPDIDKLIKGINEISCNYKAFSRNASGLSKKYFSIDRMTYQYEAIFNLYKK